MNIRGIIERKLNIPSRINNRGKFIPVKIKTKEDGIIWIGDICFEQDRDTLLETARLCQKILYIHNENNDELIGKVHVQSLLFERD